MTAAPAAGRPARAPAWATALACPVCGVPQPITVRIVTTGLPSTAAVRLIPEDITALAAHLTATHPEDY